MQTINTLLIANRGEIACRIIRTARAMGIRCIIVYSEADANSRAVRLADAAYCIGPPPSQQSYLNIQAIIDVAKKVNADAIHPGYGFLSESVEFVSACEAANIIFIGPPVSAIRAMANKDDAKQIIEKVGVAVLAGYHGADQSVNTFINAAAQVGYPVLLKPVAGGGGKGMHIVRHENEFANTIAIAKREAKASFANDHLLLEKYLENPRHVEVQIFADHHGNIVHLFTRDCSIQRRHQKIIEEAPAPALTKDLQEKIGEIAKLAVKTIGYVNAGTIEFLLDERHQFYFLEMNTRLQVEHPVTEMITGIDLVEWQIRIAQGEHLPLKQQQITYKGHAIEARICAEDPTNQFMPSTGLINYLNLPVLNKDIRFDMGWEQGDQVSSFYDAMLGKLIVYADTRAHACQKLLCALSELKIIGVHTNIEFVANVIRHYDFYHANISTHFLMNHDHQLLKNIEELTMVELALIVAALICQTKLVSSSSNNEHEELNYAKQKPWEIKDAWRMNLPAIQHFNFYYRAKKYQIAVNGCGENIYQFKEQHVFVNKNSSQQTSELFSNDLNGLNDSNHFNHLNQPAEQVVKKSAKKITPKLEKIIIKPTEKNDVKLIEKNNARVEEKNGIKSLRKNTEIEELINKKNNELITLNILGFSFNGEIQITLNQQVYKATVIFIKHQLHLFYECTHRIIQLEDGNTIMSETDAQNHLYSPMPGTITAIHVAIGQTVKQGDHLLTVEAMKMEHTIVAPRSATVSEIYFNLGQQVEEGIELVALSDE